MCLCVCPSPREREREANHDNAGNVPPIPGSPSIRSRNVPRARAMRDELRNGGAYYTCLSRER